VEATVATEATSSATPFWCGSVSFVIVQNSWKALEGSALASAWLSEITQSERWSRSVGVEIRSRRTTSSVAAPRDFYETGRVARIAPASPDFP
jgi:hypothetical protein